ncbi:MAG: flagellar protein FlaG, partial [Oceanospirillum sp.]|nr:flagellar protein FlaG [Oceanospirillum sp.]
TDAYSHSMEVRQKNSASQVDRATTEAGIKLENARAAAVEELKSTMSGKEGSEDDLRDAVEKVNQYADIQKVSLRLQVEKELQQVIVKVVDIETDEVIRQIPSEQTIAIAKRLDEVMKEFLAGDTSSAFSLLSDEV